MKNKKFALMLGVVGLVYSQALNAAGCVDVLVLGRGAGHGLIKPGFTTYTTTTPPQYYKTETQSWTNIITAGGYGVTNITSQIETRSMTDYDSASGPDVYGCAEILLTPSSVVTYSGSHSESSSAEGCLAYTGNRDEEGIWSYSPTERPSCLVSAENWFNAQTGTNGSATTTQTGATSHFDLIHTVGVSPSSFDQKQSYRKTLSDEYTTGELRANVFALVEQKMNEEAAKPGPWHLNGASASQSMQPSENCISASGSVFRLALPTERDVQYKITWFEVTRDSSNNVVGDPTERSEVVKGDGTVKTNAIHRLNPPETPNRTVTVEGVYAEIMDTGNGGGGGGPAGSGSVGGGGGGHNGGGSGGGGGAKPPVDGCSSCWNISGGPRGPSAEVELSLGTGDFGMSAGTLSLQGYTPSTGLATTAALRYQGASSLVQNILQSGKLRQVSAPQTFVDIVTINAFKFEVRFYKASQRGSLDSGVYTVTGNPFVTWTIENPDASPSSYNKLRITRTYFGSTGEAYNYEYTTGWDLTPPGGGYQHQIRTTTTSGSSATRKHTYTTLNGSGTVINRHSQTYGRYSWGEALVEERTGAVGSEEITTYSYDTTFSGLIGGANGSRVPLTQVTYPNGHWEKYTYSTTGLMEKKISQFQNLGSGTDPEDNYVTEYFYTPITAAGDGGTYFPNLPRRIRELAPESTVLRDTYFVYLQYEKREIVCVDAGAAWNDADNLVTTTKYYSTENGGVDLMRVKSIEYPDGTMTFYEYAQTSTTKTVTVSEGEPNGGKTGIQNGKRTTTVVGEWGEMQTYLVSEIAGGSVVRTLDQRLYTYDSSDYFKRSPEIEYLDGTTEEYNYACCGLDTFKDRDGVVTQYYYDAAKRLTATSRLGILQTNILDAAGNVLAKLRKGTNGTYVTNMLTAYNAAGEVTAQTNALGGRTTFSKTLDGYGQTVRTTTYPDGGTSIETYYQDGSLATLTGTAVFPVRYTSGRAYDGSSYKHTSTEIKLDGAGDDTDEQIVTYSDHVGNAYKTVYAAASGTPESVRYYNSKNQLWKSVDPDGVTTLYQYNNKGELEYTALDLNLDDTINPAGKDQITRTVRSYGTVSSMDVIRTSVYGWNTDSSTVSNLLSVSERTVDGLRSWQTTYRDASTPVTSQSRIVYSAGGNRYSTNTAPDGAYTVSHYQNGRLLSVTQKDSGHNQIGKVDYTYDPHGRVLKVTDARNGATTYTYNAADQVETVTTPAATSGTAPQVTSNYYDTSLRVWKTVQPDNSATTNEFYPTGLLKWTYGGRTYPVQYEYDPQGRMKTMKTYQNFSGNSASPGTAATTTWNYNQYRGWLDNKRDADNKGADYTYTAGGRLASRTWERGTITTYSYGFNDTTFSDDQHGDLVKVDYSDSTPDVTKAYDRRGRQKAAVANGITTSMAYNFVGQLLSETNTGSILSGYTVTNIYDSYLRRTKLDVRQSNTVKVVYNYAYDNASRLQTVDDGTYSATYTYLANSPLVSDIAFKSNSVTRMSTSKQYDALNRLTSIASTPSGSGEKPFSYGYQYNYGNQRKRITQQDGSFWYYEYDDLGQVISGKKFWADNTPVAGQQFEYGFDDIGNRKTTKSGGDNLGQNLRTATYDPNDLNQYDERTVPNTFDVVGIAPATASVLVNGSAADQRKVEYFREQVTVTNTASAVWMFVAVTNTSGSVTNGNLGNLFVPKTAEVFAYDADGNLTNDGRFRYEWDGENRLTAMVANTAVGPQQRIEFTYDYKSRRIRKLLRNGTATNSPVSFAQTYVYDGWNVVLETASNNATHRTWMWGKDLSGSEQGAGGVGGLLMYQDAQAAVGTYFPAYDGNGNVMSLVNATNGITAATYEYGPFGEMIRKTGTAATANVMRFSTKYQDDETDLLYYGYRFYNPSTGRWGNRDPIGELGGPNLYTFVYNNPVKWIDYLGREIVFEGDDKLKEAAGKMLTAAKDLANDELKKKIAEIEADKFTCKIKLAFGSKAVIVGSYALETIDLEDIEKFPESGGAATRVATFVHELIEQWEKQKNGKPYLVAHSEGMKMEFSVTGNVRGAQGTAVKNADGSFSIPINWKQKIKSKITKDGVETTEEKTIDITQTMTILDGAIVKVETVEKK